MVSAEVGERRGRRDQERDSRHRPKDRESSQGLAQAHRARAVEEHRTQDEEPEDGRVARQGSVAPARPGVQSEEAREVIGQVAHVHHRDIDTILQRHGCVARVRDVGCLAAAEHEPHANRAQNGGNPDLGEMTPASLQDQDAQGRNEHIEGRIATAFIAQECGQARHAQESPTSPPLCVQCGVQGCAVAEDAGDRPGRGVVGSDEIQAHRRPRDECCQRNTGSDFTA